MPRTTVREPDKVVLSGYRQGAFSGSVQACHYDPDDLDWYVYGLGTVTPNAAQVMPDPTTRLYEFTGAMFTVVTPSFHLNCQQEVSVSH